MKCQNSDQNINLVPNFVLDFLKKKRRKKEKQTKPQTNNPCSSKHCECGIFGITYLYLKLGVWKLAI